MQHACVWHWYCCYARQLGAADVEIEVPSGENAELKHSPFKAWSRSVCSHACHAYCQGFLPCLFLPFQSIHLHFSPKNKTRFFLVLALANIGSCVGLQNTIGHPVGCGFPCWVPLEYNRLKNKNMTCGNMTCEMNNLEIKFVFSPDVILCGWLGSKHQLTNYCCYA